MTPATLPLAVEKGIWVTTQEATTRRTGEYDHLVPQLALLPAFAPGHPERLRLRDELATGFLPLVRNIAARYSGRGEPSEDLRQVGTIGLIGALDRYAPDPGITDPIGAFLGFAVPTVTGEIRRHFRDRTWAMRVPRRTKELIAPVRDAAAVLAREFGRAARPTEIASVIEAGVDEVIEALQAQNAYRPDSLDLPVQRDGPPIADRFGGLDAALETVTYRQELRAALDSLPARERHMVVLRFFGDMTQTDIAEQMGLSQMHVSRLLSRSLGELRARMGAH